MNLKQILGLNEYSTWSGATSIGSVVTMLMSNDPLVAKLCALIILAVNAFDMVRQEKKNG